MGQQGSSQNDEQLKSLQESTKLGESQLRAAIKGFKKQQNSKHSNAISRAEFVELLKQGGISSKLLANQFWKIVVKKGEEMSVEDFVNALALIGKGDWKNGFLCLVGCSTLKEKEIRGRDWV
jgi:hypothetical protein